MLGIRLCKWRQLVCGLLAFALPSSLAAQDSGRAILRSEKGVLLNGNPALVSNAIFSDDLIQTQKEQIAKIDADGSTVTIQPETIIQFEGNELVLDHGTLQVNTSRQVRVRVNCITIVPVTTEWTQYDVTDVDGRVTVAAIKNDVKIQEHGPVPRHAKQGDGSNDMTVHQGEQKTRDEHCGPAERVPTSVDAHKAILNTIQARTAGFIAVGVITCWALCRGDNPVSPTHP